MDTIDLSKAYGMFHMTKTKPDISGGIGHFMSKAVKTYNSKTDSDTLEKQMTQIHANFCGVMADQLARARDAGRKEGEASAALSLKRTPAAVETKTSESSTDVSGGMTTPLSLATEADRRRCLDMLGGKKKAATKKATDGETKKKTKPRTKKVAADN